MTQALAGRLAFITGASSGIGAATARAFSSAGARVVLSARRAGPLEALAAELENAIALPLDVRDHRAVSAALAEYPADLVLANAGLAYGADPLQVGDPDDWSEVIDTNVKGVLHVVRAALPHLLDIEGGDLVLLGSVAGRQIYPGGNVYCASKHAVRAVYEALRLDAAGSGVRITTVDPGMVETQFTLRRFKGDEQRNAATYEGMTPLTPEDVADAVLYAVTRPPHVNIGEIVMWARDQTSTTIVKRR